MYVVIVWGDINGQDQESMSNIYGPFSEEEKAKTFSSEWLKWYKTTIEKLENPD